MGRRQRRRDSEKERRWRRVVTEWRQSGLSIREFCDWQALSEASFYSWRRELSKRDREMSSDGASSMRNVPAVATAQFLPVHVVSDAVPDSRSLRCLEVDLPAGVRLRIPAGFDRQTLVDVLTALEARPC